ncbi:SpoVG family protein [Candidatus Dependentiae bacterium]|nr:SpoVG family protein [Candidatus Dependentiae bacterium]
MQNKVTEIQITPVKPREGLVGFASFIFDDAFYCSSIGIYTRPQGGYRLTYPIRKPSANNLHIFHPINKEVAQMIEEAVISKYEEVAAIF